MFLSNYDLCHRPIRAGVVGVTFKNKWKSGMPILDFRMVVLLDGDGTECELLRSK